MRLRMARAYCSRFPSIVGSWPVPSQIGAQPSAHRKTFPYRHTHMHAAIERTSDEESRDLLDTS